MLKRIATLALIPLATALVATDLSACTGKKKNARPRSLASFNGGSNTSTTKTTSVIVYLPDFETFAVSTGTHYCACGLNNLGGATVSSVRLIDPKRSGFTKTGFGTFFSNTNTTTGMVGVLGAGARGYRSTVRGPIGAGEDVSFCFTMTWRRLVSKAEICRVLATLKFAVDEADAMGNLKKGSHAGNWSGHPCQYTGSSSSSTMPKGYDNLEGDTAHWPGWYPTYSTSRKTHTYVPSRSTYAYANSECPWDTSAAKVIRNVQVRGSASTSTYLAHAKETAIWMSTQAMCPNKPKFYWCGDTPMGGPRAKRVYMARKLINFAGGQILSWPRPFNVNYPADRPFVVPAFKGNFGVEISTYRATNTTSGTWLADANGASSSLSRGTSSTNGTGCPINWTTSHFITWDGGEIMSYIDVRENGLPVVGWLGTPLATPILFPGTTNCRLYCLPIFIQSAVSGGKDKRSPKGTQGRAWFNWGAVPKGLGTFTVCYQYAVVKPGYPFLGAIGVSRGRTINSGEGWTHPHAACYGSVYAYGTNLNFDGNGNPDTTPVASFLSTTAIIWNIQ